MKILVAEDDTYTRQGLIEVLEREGYQTLCAENGEQALDLYTDQKPDLLCLDIMMPNKDGYEVCKTIRRHDTSTPILFISAKSEEVDKVLGLELGADDFIQKPFGMREVIARIRAVTRRAYAVRKENERPKTFQLGDLSVQPAELRARRGDKTIDLSLREVRLLTEFYQHPGMVLSRDHLLDSCWGQAYFPNSRTLDQHIAQLRKRIEINAASPRLIQTVHGAGYRYDPPEVK